MVVRMNDKQTSDSVVAALRTRVIHQFGPMEQLSIASAREFESKQMDDWAKRNNVVIIKPLAYNAQANAASERFWFCQRVSAPLLRQLQNHHASMPPTSHAPPLVQGSILKAHP